VTTELPKGLTTFGCVDGIWVTNWACAIPLAAALRAGVIEVAMSVRAQDGKQGKMELIYRYLSSSEFRHRVLGIVESFRAMREDLETEKRSHQKAWAKREKQLELAAAQTAGMWGDLHGILGASLPVIAQLEFPALENKADDEPPS
jgi:hypothetical protein